MQGASEPSFKRIGIAPPSSDNGQFTEQELFEFAEAFLRQRLRGSQHPWPLVMYGMPEDEVASKVITYIRDF